MTHIRVGAVVVRRTSVTPDGPEELGHEVAERPAQRSHGTDRVAEPVEGPRDVQGLAAGEPDDAAGPVDRSRDDRVEGVDDVEGGAQPERVDHCSSLPRSARVAWVAVPPTPLVDSAPEVAGSRW